MVSAIEAYCGCLTDDLGAGQVEPTSRVLVFKLSAPESALSLCVSTPETHQLLSFKDKPGLAFTSGVITDPSDIMPHQSPRPYAILVQALYSVQH